MPSVDDLKNARAEMLNSALAKNTMAAWAKAIADGPPGNWRQRPTSDKQYNYLKNLQNGLRSYSEGHGWTTVHHWCLLNRAIPETQGETSRYIDALIQIQKASRTEVVDENDVMEVLQAIKEVPVP